MKGNCKKSITYHVEPETIVDTKCDSLDMAMIGIWTVSAPDMKYREQKNGDRYVIVKTTTYQEREIIDPTNEEVIEAVKRVRESRKKGSQ